MMRIHSALSLASIALGLHPLWACASTPDTNMAAETAALGGSTGTTTIVVQHSGKCLDVRGGPSAMTDGARIEQWTCTGQSNQAWTLVDKGNGQYQLAAASSGKCVDLVGGATSNGTYLEQRTCSPSTQQLWRPKARGDGRFDLVSVASNRCLDIRGGVSATGDGVFAELWDCTGQANQAWTLTIPPSSSSSDIANVQIVAKHSGKCLDVRGGPSATADGASIEQWTCSGQANQSWTLKATSNQQFALVAKSSGKCVDLANKGSTNGTAIQQATCSSSPTQLWTRKDLGSGLSALVSVSSGRCLDVTGGTNATSDGILTQLWDCTGLANQAWAIGGAPPPPMATADPGSAGSTTSGPYGQDASAYELVFHDEFEGTSLDTNVWTDHLWYQPANPTPSYSVSGGSLKIWPVAGSDYSRDYRHVTTDGRYYQTYGYFEIEAKLPHGRGPWPAFWLYNHDGATDRPEIDIMEAYPGGGPDSGWSDQNLHPTAYAATIWTGAPGAMGGTKMLQTPDLSAAFHRYAVKWTASQQTYYFDGQPFYTANVSMGSRMYILLSFQFGSASNAGDATTPTGPSNAFEVRYVRAWKMK